LIPRRRGRKERRIWKSIGRNGEQNPEKFTRENGEQNPGRTIDENFTPEKKSSETRTQDETPATDSEKSEARLDQGILIKTFQGLQHVLQGLSQGIKKPIYDGSDAVPQGKRMSYTSRPSSPWTPLGGYSKTSVLGILGRNQLKREPNPLKIGNYWKRRKFKVPG
jgi:hypothetical protein